MTDLRIKPLNPDNASEVRTLIGFVDRLGARDYPFAKLTSPHFWTAHSGTRFITFQLLRNSVLVGAFALRGISTQSGPLLEVLFPFFAPEAHFDSEPISSLASDAILGQAARQGATSLIGFLVPEFGGSFALQKRILQLAEVAIFPLGGTASGLAGRSAFHGEVVCGVRTLDKSENEPSPPPELFVPEQHKRLIKRLYGGAGLIRAIEGHLHSSMADLSLRNLLRQERAATKPIDLPGIHTTPLLRFQSRLTFISPRQPLSSSEKVLEVLAKYDRVSPGLNHFAALDIHAPEAPALISEIERRGYIFCGVVPSRYGNDHLILRRPPENAKKLSILSEELLSESELASYIGNQNAIKDLKAHAHAA